MTPENNKLRTPVHFAADSAYRSKRTLAIFTHSFSPLGHQIPITHTNLTIPKNTVFIFGDIRFAKCARDCAKTSKCRRLIEKHFTTSIGCLYLSPNRRMARYCPVVHLVVGLVWPPNRLESHNWFLWLSLKLGQLEEVRESG